MLHNIMSHQISKEQRLVWLLEERERNVHRTLIHFDQKLTEKH